MKILIWGYGGLGQRYARILQGLGAEVQVLSQHGTKDFPCHQELGKALSFRPDWVFVTSKTAEHLSQLLQLKKAAYAGSVFVEKPIFDRFSSEIFNFKNLVVGYNLRALSLVQHLKNHLRQEKVISAEFYVGHYLPDWRPQQDYRQSYSAHRSQGGGVLRDLSHELDLVHFLLGPSQWVYGQGGHYSSLEIDSEDCFSLLMSTMACPLVHVHMNYLDRSPRRYIHLQTDQTTYHLDFIQNTLQLGQKVVHGQEGIRDSYDVMARKVLSSQLQGLAGLEDGLQVLRIIEAAEKSQREGQRIQL